MLDGDEPQPLPRPSLERLEDLNIIDIDLQVTSTQELEQVKDSLERAILQRAEKLKSPARQELLSKQLNHIEKELGGQLDPDDCATPMSLDHLELYHAFLARTKVPDDCPLASQHDKLTTKVENMIKSHPLQGQSRSKDRKAGNHGSAYLKVPTARRRQTCAVLFLSLLTGPPLTFLVAFTLLWFIPYLWILFLLYCGWVVYDERKLAKDRPSKARIVVWWRKSVVFEYYRDFFPIRIIKANPAAQYDNKKNFLFCYHPHGVQSSGALAMASSAAGFDHLFPGLQLHLQTLSMNFKAPFLRESVIMLGLGDASRESITNALTAGPGSSATLVTGGAHESMYAHPYKSKVVINTRAGFVKIAMQTGAYLVPVWGFGENNVYENMAEGNEWMVNWQRKIQQVITFAPLLVHGRGIFNYSFGLLPHRRPISVVVGEPMFVQKVEGEIPREQVGAVHTQYKEALLELFNTYKDIYDPKAEPIEFI